MKRILLIVSLLLAPSFALAKMQFHAGANVNVGFYNTTAGVRAGVKDGENLYSVLGNRALSLKKDSTFLNDEYLVGVSYRRYLPKMSVFKPLVEVAVLTAYDTKKGNADGLVVTWGTGLSWQVFDKVNLVSGVVSTCTEEFACASSVYTELSTEI